MPVRSKKIKKISPDTGIPDDFAYCRKCMRVLKKSYMFMSAIDPLDSNGVMSVCKPCCNQIYKSSMESESGNRQLALLRTCKTLNMAYNEDAMQAALRQIESKQSDEFETFIGLYKAKLVAVLRTSPTDTGRTMDLTFQNVVNVEMNQETPDPNIVTDEVIEFWGKGLNIDDYAWLEKRYDKYASTHSSDSTVEQSLIREIVFAELDIEKTRKGGGDVSSLVDDWQKLIKSANLTSMANQPKNTDTIGLIIKQIEQSEPAELFGDERDAFKDFSNIEWYFEKYVTRPLKNFVTQSRDFNVEDTEGDDSDFDEFNIDLPEVEPVTEDDLKILDENLED